MVAPLRWLTSKSLSTRRRRAHVLCLGSYSHRNLAAFDEDLGWAGWHRWHSRFGPGFGRILMVILFQQPGVFARQNDFLTPSYTYSNYSRRYTFDSTGKSMEVYRKYSTSRTYSHRLQEPAMPVAEVYRGVLEAKEFSGSGASWKSSKAVGTCHCRSAIQVPSHANRRMPSVDTTNSGARAL